LNLIDLDDVGSLEGFAGFAFPFENGDFRVFVHWGSGLLEKLLTENEKLGFEIGFRNGR